ncbi:MAG: N-6 DNA methylase [Candidatus Cloacimonadales bacterium]|nr:N-6 DNA methylase [Candidatus Cloacimonadales bacterium]
MNSILNIDYWRKSLGLLPMKLFSDSVNEHILLNGNVGNFCIDFVADKSYEDYYSYAWSSNTNNFITIKEDKLNLYNWLLNRNEVYPIEKISNKIDKFYSYLLQNSYSSELDIVPFIINIFKSLRNFTDEKDEGVQALNHLLLLLAAYDDGVDFCNIDREKWYISDFSTEAGTEDFLEEFKRGIGASNLKPNIELILRHSSGQLFQEAQKEAIFPVNREKDLFGFYDTEYELKKKLFSSFHYTPSYLVRSIVENSLSELNISEMTTIKIFDPACGSAEFLLEALKQLKSIGYKGDVIIKGWDLSESAINISNFLLKYEQREWANKLLFEFEKVENSLTQDWENDYDLILMNPPFSSWELMNKDNREIVSDVLNTKSRKRPNLASAFIIKSIRHLRENGIFGAVIPSSILLMDSYKDLRNEIKESLSLKLVGKLGNYVFKNALTDISILIGKKPKTECNTTLLWTKNEPGIVSTALRDLRKVNYQMLPYIKDKKTHSIYKVNRYPQKENWKIISFLEQKLIKQLNELVAMGNLKTVQDIFNVKQGIRTGNNKIFIITKDQYENLPNEEKTFFRPSIDNKSIKNGVLSKVNYVWFPYSNSKNLLITSENELIQNASTYYNKYLFRYKEHLINRKKDIPFWWSLSDYAPRLIPFSTKLVSTEFGKSGSFAFDEKGEYVVERGNGWIPKKEFEKIDYNYAYIAILNSSIFEQLLSIYSRQLAGGKWYDLGKKYTSKIPIPEINNDIVEAKVYNKLVQLGKSINEGDFSVVQLIDEILIKYFYKLQFYESNN